VNIEQEFSLVELHIGMPNAVFRSLKKVWVCGRTLNILRMDEVESEKKGGLKRSKKKPAARNKSDSRNAPKKPHNKKASKRKKGKKTKT